MQIRLLILFLVAGVLAAGCSSTPIRDLGLDKLAPRKAEQELSTGLKNYEDGNYQTAAKYLQNALNTGLTFQNDRVAAHKYLAFINCVSDREKQCREEFKKALEIDPTLELTTSEAGHPIWGPVFRALKAEQPPSKKN